MPSAMCGEQSMAWEHDQCGTAIRTRRRSVNHPICFWLASNSFATSTTGVVRAWRTSSLNTPPGPGLKKPPYDLAVRDVGIASARVPEVYRDENMGSIR